ncbi:camp-dependent protein kinase type II regulatory chain [Testicularia cyperi]|uniref:cAMP-dependent protein kinase regulatory subunit n=1 Tax=Testicularia cyperi TaxID=1882483 RepID=A0A317XKQ6_9BASI|nr:camp-dependent protein kinase type II regulatory chain [Testicularia cyperi]
MPHTLTYTTILNDLNRDVAKARPVDPLQFCANWFNARLEEQRRQLMGVRSGPSDNPFAASGASVGPSDTDVGPIVPGMASPTQRASIFTSDPFSQAGSNFGSAGTTANDSLFGQNASPFGASSGASAASAAAAATAAAGSSSSTAPVPMDASESPEAVSSTAAHLIPPTFNLGRRTSVSAESMAPSATGTNQDGSPLPKTVIPKSEEQMQRIRGSIGNNLLFRNLEQDQYRDVLLAMKEVQVDANVAVIEQGAQGDYFYVVESGTLDVYIRSTPRAASATLEDLEKPSGSLSALGDKKVSYGPGSSFGELALLYAQPRAATVLSTSSCTLWALDRITFRSILMETNSRRRALYEKFLMDVPLFERLSSAERAKISDSLELREYSAGEPVIVQGERGSEFFIIVEGNAEVRKAKQGDPEEVVGKLSRGDYFGELALLNNAPRAATVAAVPNQDAQSSSAKLRVVTMSERAFTRLLGPLAGILERHAKETYGDYDSSAAVVDLFPTTSLAGGDDAPGFPHPMDSTAKPGEGAWSAPNPFAAGAAPALGTSGLGGNRNPAM